MPRNENSTLNISQLHRRPRNYLCRVRSFPIAASFLGYRQRRDGGRDGNECGWSGRVDKPFEGEQGEIFLFFALIHI